MYFLLLLRRRKYPRFIIFDVDVGARGRAATKELTDRTRKLKAKRRPSRGVSAAVDRHVREEPRERLEP